MGGDAGDAGQGPGRGRCVLLEHPGRSTVPAPWAELGGGEFINHHVWAFCNHHEVQLTRGRPHKKDDNTHVEQKNRTHIRPLFGWERIDTGEAVELLNDLYRHEWRWMMNLFPPSVKLLRKERIGSRVRRVYDAPTTPLDRLLQDAHADMARLAALVALRKRLDPFELSNRIQRKINRVHRTARPANNSPAQPRNTSSRPTAKKAHPLLDRPPQGGGRPHPETPHALP